MSPSNSNVLKGQQGFGLISALFVITVLAVVIATLSSLQTDSALSSSTQIQSQRAYFSAESGLEVALNLLIPPSPSVSLSCATSPFYSFTYSSSGLAGCRVDVECTSQTINSIDYFTLVSIGSCGSGGEASTRSIEMLVR
ncbi:MAG: pilus assembly PilX N-terminal domain-containing protein [Oleibacter sp.]|nr:pilus assembly PilX N-terminal domain-containing protein [Thalassolituus sp.]